MSVHCVVYLCMSLKFPTLSILICQWLCQEMEESRCGSVDLSSDTLLYILIIVNNY